jgi:predicted CXXCH cytochrome family protein
MTFLLLLAAFAAGGTIGNTRAASAEITQAAPVETSQATPAPDTSGYAWEASCKDCHGDIHAAWGRTKHATAINSLSQEQRGQECVRCHVTGAQSLIKDDAGKPVNAGVQCESCHGAAREHAATAATGAPTKLRKPDQKLCESCHNSKSPHFRGFFYAAMAPLVHKVK